MCGIVGYVGPRRVVDVLVPGLSHLEYRGYDSAGIALNHGTSVSVLKRAGRVSDLMELVEMERGVFRTMTSCGWFFDDIGGLEARQVLRYAAHTMALTGPDAEWLREGFSAQLGDARSNDPALGSAADIFQAL